MSFRSRLFLAVAATVAVVAVTAAALTLTTPGTAGGLASAGSTPLPAGTATPDHAATLAESADAFLSAWVEDGRVVRHDQGGDTVSEGQAYGLLIALAADDKNAFADIWTWTSTHLVRPDGLLAWRWADGAVVDAEPASDADVDAARALVLAGERWGDPAYTRAGVALATVVADTLTVQTQLGRILVPGLWAAKADPYQYNPSYASPVAFAVLGKATGDPRWAELAAGSAAVTGRLLERSDLPPDWAQVHGDGTVEPMPGAAGAGQSVRYGYDAARVAVRYAESCQRSDAALAAKLAPALDRTDPLAAELDLGGAPLAPSTHPLGYAARAAARASAGNPSGAMADLALARTAAIESPTYFGAAWSVLGTALLESKALGGCPPLAGHVPTTSAASAGSAAPAALGVGAAAGFQDPDLTARESNSARSATPTHVSIPAIGVESGLETLAIGADGRLQPPVDWQSAGWYGQGVVPGDLGPAVIAGHVDSPTGPAVFLDLSKVAAGDAVIVTMSDGAADTYTVDRALRAPKAEFPTSEVYAPTPTPQLRIITCGGAWNPAIHHYTDNLVVFATLSSSTRTR